MNRIGGQAIDSRMVMIFMIICALTAATGLVLAKASTFVAVAVTVGLVAAIIGFVNTELALYILIVAMLLGPQITAGPAEAFVARGRGGMTLRFDDFLLVVIGISWFLRAAIDKRLGLFRSTPLNLPIGLYFLACLLSTLFGYLFERVTSLVGILSVLKYFEYFFIYFMVVDHLRDKRQVERFTAVLLLVCFIICLYAIYQIPGGERASAPFEGPQGEPNTLGGYLVLMLSLALGLLLHYGSKTKKVLLGILVFFIMIALGATLSRTSWLALVPILLTLIYFTRRKMIIVVPLLIVILISPMILPKAVVDRALYTINQPPEKGQLIIGGARIDTSTSERLESYRIILTRDFLKQPLLGYGVSGYSFVDAQYTKVLAEAGIIGFTAFIYLLYSTYRNARLTFRKTRDPFFSGLALGYLAGFMAMLTHAIGANTFVIVRIMEPFWFLTAMVIMIPFIEVGETQFQTNMADPVRNQS
jgi:O-antigen ligase